MKPPTLDYRAGREARTDRSDAGRHVTGPIAAHCAIWSVVTLSVAALSLSTTFAAIGLACALFALVAGVFGLVWSRGTSISSRVALAVCGAEFLLLLYLLGDLRWM